MIGAGVAGLCCALELSRAGAQVDIVDKSAGLGADACSWFAGGMLAPWCEGESAEPLVVELGAESIAWWREAGVPLQERGSLVLSKPRDRSELTRFARRTAEHRFVSSEELQSLEPDLGSRFDTALYFPREAHLDPRGALQHLQGELASRGISVQYGVGAQTVQHGYERVVDCRGFAAKPDLGALRGVKGEMLLLRSSEFSLSRPVRLLHPRIPLYIVPRGKGIYMVGATMIESEDRSRITARSLIELLQGAYAVHPALAEAEVLETGCDVRPAFANNLPRLWRNGKTLHVNGLYRHGFLLAPSLARFAARALLHDTPIPKGLHDNPM